MSRFPKRSCRWHPHIKQDCSHHSADGFAHLRGLQEHIRQASEDLIPYHRFSIRLAKRDIEQLPAILKAIDDEEISRLQHGLIKYHRCAAS